MYLSLYHFWLVTFYCGFVIPVARRLPQIFMPVMPILTNNLQFFTMPVSKLSKIRKTNFTTNTLINTSLTAFTKAIRLMVLALFVVTQASAQNNGNYPSLLWKISGKGLQKPSYLYGTMHVSSKVAWHLSDEFFDALKSVDVVGLETSPGTWLDNMQATGELMELSKAKPNYTDESDFYANVFKAQFPERQVLAAILSYDPDIINGLLYRKNRSRENFEEATYVDLFIFQTASKLNKKVISLEDFVESEIQARLAQVPDDEDEAIPSYMMNSFGSDKIEDAYRDGNLDLLDSLSKKQSSKNTQKHLIEIRNKYFVHTIDSVLKKQTLFSGVGAAHLPGKSGVIEMLRELGYTVEPVMGHKSRRGDSQKEKFTQMEKPRVFSTQFIEDSTFSADFPGKLYPIFLSPVLKYYVQPDMINGHFYTVVRLRHNAQAFGYTPKDLMARIDSLLFENIAGKILDIKPLKMADNMLGIEVVSRTVTGNVQRYHISVNETELFLFKLGGKNDYAVGKDAGRFFNSIKFYPEPNSVKTFEPKYGGFKVKMKGRGQYYFDNPGSVGPVEDLLVRDGKQLLSIQHASFNDFDYLEEDTFELRQITSDLLKNYGYESNSSYVFDPFQGYPSIRFQAKNKRSQKMDGRVVIKNTHYYLMFLVSQADANTDYSLFDSFQITDFKSTDNTVKIIRDEDMKFTVSDEIGNDATAAFNARYKAAYKEAFPNKDKDTVGITESDYHSKLYYSPSSNDYVLIEHWHHNPYDYQTKESMFKALNRNVGNNSSLKRTNVKTFEKGDRLEYSCLFRDTATSRVIALKIMESRGQTHQISVPFDSTFGMTGYRKAFYDSFTPIDTIADRSIFEPHFKEVLEILKGSDSTKREVALNALSEINYDKVYLKDFMAFVNDPSFNTLSEKVKSAVLSRGGYINDASIIPMYKKLYQQYTDSFYLQLSVLKGLARLNQIEGHKAFAQLLSSNPVLIGDEEVLDNLFYVVKDSIELCKHLLPEILGLCRYEEYRPAVCDMLADMDKHLVLSARERADLLSDANLAIKRKAQNSAQNTDRSKITDFTEMLRYSGYHDYNSNDKEYESYTKPLLLSYVKIFAPFYDKDPAVKSFFIKLWRLREQEYIVPSATEIMRYAPAAIDSLVNTCIAIEKFLAPLVIQANHYKLDSLLPKGKYDQQQLIRSFLLNKEIGGDNGKTGDKAGKDTLQFLKSVDVQNRYQSGTMYFYKRQVMSTPRWTIVFVQKSKQTVSPFVELIDGSYRFDQEKTEEQNTKEVIEWFNKRYRKRSGGGYR